MTFSDQAIDKAEELGIDLADVEAGYFSGRDRTVREYRAGSVSQYRGSRVYYLVRETSHGDGNHLQWVGNQEWWEEQEDREQEAREVERRAYDGSEWDDSCRN